jgi:hypothetical protein
LYRNIALLVRAAREKDRRTKLPAEHLRKVRFRITRAVWQTKKDLGLANAMEEIDRQSPLVFHDFVSKKVPSRKTRTPPNSLIDEAQFPLSPELMLRLQEFLYAKANRKNEIKFLANLLRSEADRLDAFCKPPSLR